MKKKKAKSEKSLQSAKESIQFAVNAAIDLEALLTIFQKPCPRNSLKSGTKCLEMQILMILPLKRNPADQEDAQ